MALNFDTMGSPPSNLPVALMAQVLQGGEAEAGCHADPDCVEGLQAESRVPPPPTGHHQVTGPGQRKLCTQKVEHAFFMMRPSYDYILMILSHWESSKL